MWYRCSTSGVLCHYILRFCQGSRGPYALSSHHLHQICLQHIHFACMLSHHAPKINKCYLMIELFSEICGFNVFKKLRNKEGIIPFCKLSIYLCNNFPLIRIQSMLISASCQSVVSASCRAFSFLRRLMFSSCRKQSIVTRAGGGRPVETNGLAFDK